ncbi:MAG TPA: TetR/AcrR family transcriptional regulator [Burkholderiaceae bacterium]|jgi:TetR/AcrR family transcriptional repressor of mexJK operon
MTTAPARTAKAPTSVNRPAKPARPDKPIKPAKPAKPTKRVGAGRPRAEDVEARAQELLLTAGKLFLKKGYSNVSLEMIAREAQVATRTIYVKFGGKAGILTALMEDKRASYQSFMTLAQDQRPIRTALGEFAHELHNLISLPESLALHRIVVAEAHVNPELVETFFNAGPGITLQSLRSYFARPDIRMQLREDLPFEQLPAYFATCVLGDSVSRMLNRGRNMSGAALDARLDMFLRGVMR